MSLDVFDPAQFIINYYTWKFAMMNFFDTETV